MSKPHGLLIDIFSIADGNDGDDKVCIYNLIDNAVVADTYSPGVTSFRVDHAGYQ